ncbi:MAG: SPASM domain-containing protein [Candidatus Gastranaerophilales bacterium]|nr:SPASM domain-containing protein [Candidatus Gastranaerophilales bacterium]
MENNQFCQNPWNCFEINNDGRCFFCNPCFSNFNSIGNLFEDDIDTIWNGEKAQNYRKDVLEKKYTCCNYDNCNGRKVDELPFDTLIAPYPEYVNIGYDFTCSQRCIICRDKHQALSPEEQAKWEGILESHILPITSKAKYMFINCRGEFFDSKHTQKMYRAIINNNPDLKIDFISNGIKCTKENLEAFDLLNRIYRIHISIHAATKETYQKIFRVDMFNQVMENVRFISSLKKSGKLEDFEIMFVITNENYKDMLAFVKLAEELDARATFSACIGGYADYIMNREEYAVFYQNHRNYNDFVKMVKSPVFNSKHCYLPDYLRNLQPVSFKHSVENKLKYIGRTYFKMDIAQNKDNIQIFSHDTYK